MEYWEAKVFIITTVITLALASALVLSGYLLNFSEVCSILTVPTFTIIAIPLFLAVCLFGITLFVALSTRLTSLCGDDVREWWARAGGWMLIAGLAWLVLSVLVIFGPVLLAEVPGWISGIGGGVAGIVTFILGRSGKARAISEQGRQLSLLDKILSHIATVATVLFLVIFFIFLSWLTSEWLLPLANWLLNQLPWFSSKPLSDPIKELTYLETIVATSWSSVLCLLVVMLTIGLIWASLIDLNIFSLHQKLSGKKILM